MKDKEKIQRIGKRRRLTNPGKIPCLCRESSLISSQKHQSASRAGTPVRVGECNPKRGGRLEQDIGGGALGGIRNKQTTKKTLTSPDRRESSKLGLSDVPKSGMGIY